MSEFIDQLKAVVKSRPFLVHAKNIIVQSAKLTKPKVSEKEMSQLLGLTQIITRYKAYYEANLLKGTNDETIRLRVRALNEYYNFIRDNGYDNLFNAQTKFRPTILEEFMAILFRDLVAEVELECPGCKLGMGPIKAYTNLYFYGRNFRSFVRSPTIGLNLKDQDFAIYRDVSIKMNNNKPISTSLPIVAVECKTFIDKTMLEGSVATAEKIKAGNPYAFFCIVSELYDVGPDVDPVYSRINQIYILRQTSRRGAWKEIDEQIVIDLVSDVKRHLERPWSDVAKKLVETGKLI